MVSLRFESRIAGALLHSYGDHHRVTYMMPELGSMIS